MRALNSATSQGGRNRAGSRVKEDAYGGCLCRQCVGREAGNSRGCLFTNLLSKVHQTEPLGPVRTRAQLPLQAVTLEPDLESLPGALTPDSGTLNAGGGDLSQMAASGQWKVGRGDVRGETRPLGGARAGWPWLCGLRQVHRATGPHWQSTSQSLHPHVGQPSVQRL